MIAPVRRAANGRFVRTLCTDPNCDGALQLVEHRAPDGTVSHWWECDGLTHDRPDGPLRDCHRSVEAYPGKEPA
jgi:hypothetical protein